MGMCNGPFGVWSRQTEQGYLGEMLENYLALAGGGEYTPELGAVYIAWSSSNREMLQIGVARDTIEEEIRWLDEELGLSDRHGLLAAWLVHDVDEALLTVGPKIAAYNRKGLGYAMRLSDAKAEIQAVLDATANTVLSPWHGEDEKPQARYSPKVA